MKKLLSNSLLTFILGALIFGSIGTILAYKLGVNQVSYTPNDQTLITMLVILLCML